LAYATINDMPDIDGDGIPDYKDTDNDNDGINNTIDYLLGNASNLNTTIANISIFINSSNNISQIFNTTLLVNITSGNSTLVVFNWSFSNSSVLNLYNVTIARQANTSNNGSLLIRGIALPQNQTKTAYMDRIANISYVCIKDAEINSIANISSGCNGTNEFFISCNASLQGQYSCNTTANNLSYIITGINNSGIREQCRDNDNDGYGTGCSLGTDCNDNNANIHPGASETCGNGVDENCDGSDTACASSSSSSGGGGGGIKNDENTLSNSFLYMKPNEKYILSGKRASLAVTKILFYVNNAVIRGQLTANITNITALAENNIPPVENPYQYFQVTPSASIKGNIANAEIEFRIINSWFTNFPDISKGKIKLLRYSTSWETYYSNLVKEDINYTYYSVSVPGFSYFAVAGDKISEKPTENKTVQKETKKIVEITENKSASARIEPTAEKAKLQKEEKANYKSLMLILIIICVFILIILIIFKRSSRRKDNKEEFKKKELKPKV
jgi:PGF-pre-PGF domain-containing protein